MIADMNGREIGVKLKDRDNSGKKTGLTLLKKKVLEGFLKLFIVYVFNIYISHIKMSHCINFDLK